MERAGPQNWGKGKCLWVHGVARVKLLVCKPRARQRVALAIAVLALDCVEK